MLTQCWFDVQLSIQLFDTQQKQAIVISGDPSKTRRSQNVGGMLGQCRRRCTSFKSALSQCFVLAGKPCSDIDVTTSRQLLLKPRRL